ncbi:HMG box protein [Apiospora phragmitis]|uniref:HMG box protein n=1 Tax=Apiospora phragmitis TaxID=2905665 RepID=A0ABR1TSL0_9PEZI
MSNTRPASPAPSHYPDAGADFSNGFQHLVNYNQSVPAVGMPYPPRHQTQSPFNNHGMPMYPSPYEGTPSHGGTPGYYHDDSFDSQYPDPDPGSVSHSSLGFPLATHAPAKRYALRHTTTTAANDSDPLRSVQSGGVSKPKPKPKPKAKGKKKPANGSDPKFNFDEPLSMMCKRVTDVQDADIEAWVNRTTEDRRREVEMDKNHKIKRPMNAFMLYRKHHQNRVKLRFSHENHQIVSAVCGQGWAQEPKEVIEQYNEWARLERDNHARAFPDYKFTPSKSKKAKKPNGYDSDEDWEVPELKDVFDGGLPRGGSRMQSTRARSADHPDADYHPGGRAVYSPYQPLPSHARTISHYSYQNPNKPLPSGYNTALPQSEYYAQSVQTVGHPHHHHYGHQQGMPHPGYHHENVYMIKTAQPTPVMHHHHAGTPSHHPYSHHGTPVPLSDSPYDYPPSATMSPHPGLLPPPDHHHHHDFSSGSPHPSSSMYGAPPDTGGNDFYNELNAHNDIFNLGADQHYMGDMGTPGDLDDGHHQFMDPSAFDPALSGSGLGVAAPSGLGLGDLKALDPSLQESADWRTQELDDRAMNELFESSPTDTIAAALPGGTGSEAGGG